MCFHRTGSGVDQTSNVTQFEEGEDLAALKVPESVSEKTNGLLYEKAYYEQNQPVQHVVSCGDSVPCALEGWPWSSHFYLPRWSTPSSQRDHSNPDKSSFGEIVIMWS